MKSTHIISLLQKLVEEFNDEGWMRAVNVREDKTDFRIYNKSLCPDIWTDQNKLLPEIQQTLLEIAFNFYSDAELRIPIQDVYLLGSSANYTWTPESDIDVHIIIDGSGLSMHPENAEKFLHTLTGKWNLEHDIKIKGHRVELYLQDVREKNESAGVYSIVHNEWIKIPVPENIFIDKTSIQRKYSMWVEKINDAIKREDEKTLKNILETLRDYRKSGLKRGGEFSPENLVFKILRHRGFLEKLKNGYNQIYDKKMTVKDGFDPTSQGPNPDAGTNNTDGFYRSHINRMRSLEEVSSNPTELKSKYFTVKFNNELVRHGGVIYLGDKWIANTIKPAEGWGKHAGKWIFNRTGIGIDKKFPSVDKSFNTIQDLLVWLDGWYEQNKNDIKEGYGAGIPETDRLHIKNKRWQIRSKNAPKTPKMIEKEVIAGDGHEKMKEWVNEILDGVLLTESPKQDTLKKNRKPLTDEERKQVMDAKAIWHHGPNGEETPAVWKSVVNGKTWFCCNTHRAIQIKPTLKGAIKAFEFIKTTS